MKSTLTFLIFLFLLHTSFSQSIEGEWTGELSFAGNTLDLNFFIYKENEQYLSTLSVPAQSVNDFKSTSTSLVDSILTIELKPLGITYKGKWSQLDTITGTFLQNGASLALNLVRGNKKINRPQEPKPPHTYHVEDVEFKNEIDGTNLAGTLTLPSQEGSFPAVILISGSGPQDRNSSILGHKPFLLLAHEFTQNGYAVLRYDERGVGESEGEFIEASLNDFLEDARSAVHYLQRRPEVNSEQLGLLGHSIGGVIAPQLSIQEEIAFLILLAAPGIDGDTMMLQQRADFLKLRGLTDQQIEQSNLIFKETYEFIRTTSASGDQFEVELRRFLKDNYSSNLMEKELEALVEQLTSKELLGLLRNRPARYLNKVTCPVLALGGSKDFQVAATENLEAIKNEVLKGGNSRVQVKEFDGLNHLLQECETGDLSEYGTIEQTMSPKVLEYILNWLNKSI